MRLTHCSDTFYLDYVVGQVKVYWIDSVALDVKYSNRGSFAAKFAHSFKFLDHVIDSFGIVVWLASLFP